MNAAMCSPATGTANAKPFFVNQHSAKSAATSAENMNVDLPHGYTGPTYPRSEADFTVAATTTAMTAHAAEPAKYGSDLPSQSLTSSPSARHAATDSTALAAAKHATSAYVRGSTSGATASATPSHFAGPTKIVAARNMSAAPNPPPYETARSAFSRSPRLARTIDATIEATTTTTAITMIVEDGHADVERTGRCLLMTSDCMCASARIRLPTCISWYVSATGIR